MSEVCRFCNQSQINKGKFCLLCGYDPKTDTISPLFKAKLKVQNKPLKSKSSFFVKIFVLFGVIMTIFSVFYKNNFNIPSVINNGKELLRMVNYGEFVHIGPKGKSLITNRTQTESEGARSKASAGRLIFGGIFYAPDNQSYVIINNQVLKENEFFEGILVKKIYRDKVEVEINGESRILKANESTHLVK